MEIQDAATFLYGCIQSNKAGSIATIEVRGSPNLYAQFYVCGDQNDNANGEIQTQIVGPENASASDPECTYRFDRLLHSDWTLDGGNADKVLGPFTDLEQVNVLVQSVGEILAAVYGIENPEWKFDSYSEQ